MNCIYSYETRKTVSFSPFILLASHHSGNEGKTIEIHTGIIFVLNYDKEIE